MYLECIRNQPLLFLLASKHLAVGLRREEGSAACKDRDSDQRIRESEATHVDTAARGMAV